MGYTRRYYLNPGPSQVEVWELCFLFRKVVFTRRVRLYHIAPKFRAVASPEMLRTHRQFKPARREDQNDIAPQVEYLDTVLAKKRYPY